ncbi:MAG TPA: Gfo/Idh/MocA family oxidoreductase [Alphaproteobacteria bacterium]|nr:Gfo/Idh/MocA family oxidoreductase [Alphaproteobacteria bacterium]
MSAAAPGAAVPSLALIGCGQWGRNLARNFHALGALKAVHDRDGARAAELAEAQGVPASGLEALLRDPTLKALVIATLPESHAALARLALEAGKHVFVEKPLALGVADAEALCALAREKQRVLMVGHLLQYHPAFLALKELVHNGALGRLQYIYSNRLNLGRIRREEDILWSFAPHDISMILALVGAEPEQVSAVGAYYLHGRIADVTTTHLAFPDGTRAHVFVSWLHPFKEQKLVVVGDQGMAVFDDGEPWASKVLIYRHRIEWRDGVPEAQRAEGEPVALAPEEPLGLECRHFLDCVASGAPPRTDGLEALRVLRVLEAAAETMAKGAGGSPSRVRPRINEAMVHETACVDEGCVIGEGTKVWHFSHLLAGTRIGRNCVIGQNVMIGPDVVVGERCKIQNNVSLYKGVTLEDGVFCGPSCVFTNVLTPRAEIERKAEFRPTLVKRGATIGANATILCGTTLGPYCFVAAGAIVTKDVPAYALVAGVPARRTGWVSQAGERLGADLVCPRTGRRYRESGPETLEELPNA